ncbi:hypothetical protein Hanom_Chr12g01065851 [Helianthus anomalus]
MGYEKEPTFRRWWRWWNIITSRSLSSFSPLFTANKQNTQHNKNQNPTNCNPNNNPS